MNKIIITDDLINEIAESESDFCRNVRKCDPLLGALNITSGYESQYKMLERYCGTENLKELKFLEVGSGNGFFLCYALKNGLDIIGIEPGKKYGFEGRFLRAVKLLELNQIGDIEQHLYDTTAEDMVFEDNSFDAVISVAVLEHVSDLDRTMKQLLRVLKPGGLLIINLPNYGSFYEGHYNIIWLPFLNKNMGKIYVSKVFHRDPSYIDELNFIKPKIFKKYLNGEDSRGKLMFQGPGVLKYIFETYNISSSERDIKYFITKSSKYSLFKKVIASNFGVQVIRSIIYLPVKTLGLLGFATTFTLLINKTKR